MFLGLIVIGIIIGIVVAMVQMDARVRTAAAVAAVILIVIGILGICGILPIGVDRPVVERPVIVH